MHRTLARLLFVTIIGASLMGLSSCRTSREARRTSGQRQIGSQPTLARTVDSLLMIEGKLTEIIDSMTNLVGADHERIRRLESELHSLERRTGGSPALPPSDPPSTSYGDAPPPVTAPPSLLDRYGEGLHRFRERDYDAALRIFQALERDDPNGSLAGNYKYWEGECYYGKRFYNEAMQAFRLVLEEYPSSPKVVAAHFMLGECYRATGLKKRARIAYERVIADYPNSEFRGRAEARLNILGH